MVFVRAEETSSLGRCRRARSEPMLEVVLSFTASGASGVGPAINTGFVGIKAYVMPGVNFGEEELIRSGSNQSLAGWRHLREDLLRAGVRRWGVSSGGTDSRANCRECDSRRGPEGHLVGNARGGIRHRGNCRLRCRFSSRIGEVISRDIAVARDPLNG